MATVTVKKGDSLWAIAKKNGTTVAALLKANPTIAQRRKAGKVDIYSGSKVRVPGGKSGASKPTPKGAAADTQKGRPVVKPLRPATSVGGRRESGSKPMMTTGQLKSSAASSNTKPQNLSPAMAAAARRNPKLAEALKNAQETGKKWYGSAEHRAAQKRGLIGAATIAATAATGGGAAGISAGTARLGAKAAAAKAAKATTTRMSAAGTARGVSTKTGAVLKDGKPVKFGHKKPTANQMADAARRKAAQKAAQTRAANKAKKMG